MPPRGEPRPARSARGPAPPPDRRGRWLSVLAGCPSLPAMLSVPAHRGHSAQLQVAARWPLRMPAMRRSRTQVLLILVWITPLVSCLGPWGSPDERGSASGDPGSDDGGADDAGRGHDPADGGTEASDAGHDVGHRDGGADLGPPDAASDLNPTDSARDQGHAADLQAADASGDLGAGDSGSEDTGSDISAPRRGRPTPPPARAVVGGPLRAELARGGRLRVGTGERPGAAVHRRLDRPGARADELRQGTRERRHDRGRDSGGGRPGLR